jgi:tetratricopeptide (TPR) repeat protein
MDHQSPVGGGDARDDPRVPGRLDSWKEIAAHFRRDARTVRQRVQRAEPLNPYWLVALGNEFSFARRYEEAHRSFQRALELERDNRPAVAGLADVSARTGRVAETAAWQIRYLRLTGRDDLAAAYDEACGRDGPVAAERWPDQ